MAESTELDSSYEASLNHLTPKQLQAIYLLLQEGTNQKEVAQILRIRRETLCQWCNQNSDFIRVWHSQRQIHLQALVCRQELISRLNELSSRAFKLLEKAVEEGDVEVALRLVRVFSSTKSRGKQAVTKDRDYTRSQQQSPQESNFNSLCNF